MLRKNARLRKEYLYKKALEDKEAATYEKKRKLEVAMKTGKAIPTEIRGEDQKLRKTMDLADKETKHQRSSQDDEYQFMGVRDPRLLITTSRDPSSRLMQFTKELRIIFPDCQRINRGEYSVKDIVDMARNHSMSDIVIVHEHRGEPDGLIVCHLPFGPTAYFGLSNAVMRHDLAEKPPKAAEANPHLIFHNFTAKTGLRIKTVLQALFPPPKQLGTRVMTFANVHDSIHFRHHTYERPPGPGGDDYSSKSTHVELTEVGPRFVMRLFRLELGTLDMKDVEIEWVLRPFFNRQREAIALPEEEEEAKKEEAAKELNLFTPSATAKPKKDKPKG